MKQHYLAHMGIEHWGLQKPMESCALANIYCYHLQGVTHKGVLLADGDAEDKRQAELVAAIANATCCVQQADGLVPVFEMSTIGVEPRVVVLLGQRITRAWFDEADQPRSEMLTDQEGRSVIISHAPSLLLDNKMLKAQVWHDLQQAMQLLNE